MAKAHITTADGTKVTLEGTIEEVAVLVDRLEVGTQPAKPATMRQSGSTSARSATKAQTKRSANGAITLSDLLAELIEGGFFKTPQELGVIKTSLEEQGHYYPITTISPILLAMVRRRQLRRIKENKRWRYVNP